MHGVPRCGFLFAVGGARGAAGTTVAQCHNANVNVVYRDTKPPFVCTAPGHALETVSLCYAVQTKFIVYERLRGHTTLPGRNGGVPGAGPADNASLSSTLAAESTRAPEAEAGSPRDSCIAHLDGSPDGLAADIKAAKGATLLVETVVASRQVGGSPPKDWQQVRFGENPPESLVKTMETASDGIMAAVGVNGAPFRAGDSANATMN